MAPTQAGFYADPNHEDIFLYEIAAYVRATGATETLYLSTDQFVTEPDDSPANTPYRPIVMNGFSFNAPPVEAEAVGFISGSEGETIEIAVNMGELDSWRTTYSLVGRFVTIKHGGAYSGGRLRYSQFRTVKVAQIVEVGFGLTNIKMKLAEQSKRFDSPVEDRVLRGGTSALGFDGSTTYVDFDVGLASKVAAIVNDLTLESWVYCENVAANPHTIYSSGASTNRPFHLEITTAGQLCARWSKGGVAKSATTTTLTAITTKSWHFVAASISGTTITFYVYSFVLNAWDSEVYTHADVAGRDTQTASNIYVGRTVGGSDYFNGQLDELRLSNTATAEADVREHFDRQLVTATEVLGNAALKLYIKFDDGDGPTVSDSSDSPLNGAIAALLNLRTGPGVTLESHQIGSSDGNCLTRTAGSFVADLWNAGDKGFMELWVGTALQNNGNFTVTAVTASKLSIAHDHPLSRSRDDGTSSAPKLYEYAADAHWYPTLTGGVPEDDGGEASGDHPEVPNVFGFVEGWAPVVVDAIRGIYQVHVCEIDAVVAVAEGGSLILLGTAFTDLKTFLDATPVMGTYDTLVYPGGSYIRLGSPAPAFPITIRVRGDKRGGTYASTVGDIWRRIVTTRGAQPLADPAEIDEDSFDDHDTATGNAEVGIVLESGMTIMEAGTALMESSGSVSWFRRSTGKLAILQFNGATGSVVKDADGVTDFTLTEDDIAEGSEPEPLPVAGPYWSIEVPFRRCWNLLGTTDMTGAAKLDPAVRRFNQNEYRYAKATDTSVRTMEPLASVVKRESGLLAARAAAQTEANRTLALYRDLPESWRLPCRSRAIWLDRYDVVYFDYKDFNTFNARQQRIGSATTKWIVLGVEESMDEAQVNLVLWRQDSLS